LESLLVDHVHGDAAHQQERCNHLPHRSILARAPVQLPEPEGLPADGQERGRPDSAAGWFSDEELLGHFLTCAYSNSLCGVAFSWLHPSLDLQVRTPK